jgi:hypothetical protein
LLLRKTIDQVFYAAFNSKSISMKKKNLKKLAVRKATVSNLIYREKRAFKGGISNSCNRTCEPACYSPFCGPTFQTNCDTVTTTEQDNPDTAR